jgi:hypothetical protein
LNKNKYIVVKKKRKRYGICGNILWWIRDFLANRKQNVFINGTGLEWRFLP